MLAGSPNHLTYGALTTFGTGERINTTAAPQQETDKPRGYAYVMEEKVESLTER